jgi:hypothetical protein
MKGKTILVLVIVCIGILNLAGPGFSAHKEEKGAVQGTIMKIEATEYEITVKDEKGKETKVKVKDAGGFKVGENVVIKDGKVTKAVKPITGGY